MADARRCPQCGSELPPDAPAGVCPKCVMGLGFERSAAAYDVAPTTDRGQNFVAPKPHEMEKHFPQLEILDLIGQGGMGAVYKARQRGLDRMVALKILPPQYSRDPAFAERFTREARAMARLNHPNIVAVYDSGKAGDYYFLIMEFVDGVNLREAIQTKKLTAAEALAIVPQVCDALQYAHDEGVVHRDIKPENVLLDSKGRVKVADFGLAKLLAATPEAFTLTATHQVMGTPRYMAPEQMEGSHSVDHRADIYSLGVVFYELLTGELPLGRFAPPSRKVQIDVRLDEVVLRTLEKEPEHRYQQASQVKTDVESICRVPARVSRAHGYEYRSQTTVFGLPLVHVATGIDPETGRGRVARGIIAIGGRAVGGLAIGGMAIGVVAIGGCSIGVLAIGGCAIGLLFALGGCAVGFGLSLGGAAIGLVAVGGGAIGYAAFGGGALGYYAYGGGAFGFYAYGADVQHAKAYQALHDFSFLPSIPFWIATCVVSLLYSVALIGALAGVARREEVETSYDLGTSHNVPSDSSMRGPASGIGIVVVLIALLCVLPLCLIPILAGGWYVLSDRDVVVRRPDPVFGSHPIEANPYSDRFGWEMGPNGPVVSESFGTALGLSPDQADEVNQVLQRIHQQYVELEKQHSEQTVDESGHMITTIKPFSQEKARLENELWTGLDAILDTKRQEMARRRLKVHSVDRKSLTDLSEAVRPGLLGWQDGTVRIETWKVGTWYHWKIEAHRIRHESNGPEPPGEYRRFWEEEAAAENSIDVSELPESDDE